MLLSNNWFGRMLRYKCVGARVVVVKLKFADVNLCVLDVYGPCEDRNEREKRVF